MTTPSTVVPDHALALLDASCVIDFPDELEQLAESAAVSTLTIAELAYGIHHDDPLVSATREARYRDILNEFAPIPCESISCLLRLLPISTRSWSREIRPTSRASVTSSRS